MFFRKRYLVVLIFLGASVTMFFLLQWTLGYLLVNDNAGFFDQLGESIDATVYSYFSTFFLMIVASIVGMVFFRKRGRTEFSAGFKYALILSLIIVAFFWCSVLFHL